MATKIRWTLFMMILFQTSMICGQSFGQETSNAEAWKSAETERTDNYAKQLENYLLDEILEGYAHRAKLAWNRDYSSISAFERSVEPNREKWRNIIKAPTLKKTGDLKRTPATLLPAEMNAQWVTLPLGNLTSEAILIIPENASSKNPVPLVIAMHGIGSFPERPLGLDTGGYHSYAKTLVDEGFAVLSPMNLRTVDRRNHIERYCRLAGMTLPGIELARLQHLLDAVLADPKIDSEQIGMWGVSLGGMATMFWMPLEPRIKAGIVSAWFNHRLTKMAVDDPRYTAFIATKEEHAFFNDWLTEFADHDATALICPRPLMIQHGKKDRISHWPWVVEEFDIARKHYDKLGISERIELIVHEGGHEAIVTEGVAFMTKWLKPDGPGK